MWTTTILTITLVFAVGFTRLADAQSDTSCAGNLVPCLDFVNSTNPPVSCCKSLVEGVAFDLACFCNLYSTSGLIEGFSYMNVTQALHLSQLCGLRIDASDTRCKVSLPDTLKQVDTLSSNRYLSSANGTFTLGFFEPEDNHNSYLAIWDTRNSGKPVWIANRDKPVVSGSGILTIDNNGRFLINRTGEDPIELYPGENNARVSNTSATLLDNGNLVLRVLSSDGSILRTLWQSFDYPTDTLLPGMKLGFNNRTGMKWSLTSWFAANDPSPGPFTLEWDPIGVQLVVRRRGVIFWRSGAIVEGFQAFEHMSDFQRVYNFLTQKNSEEESFTYSVDFSGSTYEGELGWQITHEGKIIVDDEANPVQDCYGYNTDEGCAEWTQPQCRNDNATIELMYGFFLGPNGEFETGFLNKSTSPADCRVNCWVDCDCLGYHITNSSYCELYIRGQFEYETSGSLIYTIVNNGNSSSAVSPPDTLYQAGSLNSSQYLASVTRNFKLGFFKPLFKDNSYLAIWNERDDSKPVWIANRGTPIVDDSGILTIDNKGRFLINRTGKDPIELYSGEKSGGVSNVSATLLDNGNLVLRVLNSNGSIQRTLWQSFDYPTDTLLPGMKLGFNNTTGMKWSLTSWFAANDPSSGPFTLEWDPMGVRLVVRQRGRIFWTSGVLNVTYETFEYMFPLITRDHHFKLVRNSNEESFTYSVDSAYNGTIGWQITYEGKIFVNHEASPPKDCCYNAVDGCAEWTQPQCRNDNATFESIDGSFFGTNGEDDAGFLNKSASPADCRVNCWVDCDCLGYHITNSSFCVTYRKDLQFRFDSSSALTDMYVIQAKASSSTSIGKNKSMAGPATLPPPPTNDALSPPPRKGKKWTWIAIVAASTLLLVTIVVIVFCLRRKHKGIGTQSIKVKYLRNLMTTPDTPPRENELEYSDNFAQNLKLFSFVSIIEATNNFSPESKLGEGGFGPVYKGELPEYPEVAIKRLSRSSGQGLEEFKNELVLIAKLQHINLVRLLGYCIQGEEKILIYEYMPNKSLDSFLFDQSKKRLLDWKERLMIIEGIAQGLLYLHQHSRLRVIHRDLKASNILLDENMNPKISDFGMARIFNRNEFMANTHRIVGTYGYMPPEYACQGIFSVKSDIFSFGVLMLEIVSGRRNNSFYDINRPLNLLGYTWELWQRSAGLELMDPILKDSCSTDLLLRFIHVALLCVEDSPTDRPTISEVISMMTNENILLPSVKRPAFLNLNIIPIYESQWNGMEYHSVNGVSISTMNAR